MHETISDPLRLCVSCRQSCLRSTLLRLIRVNVTGAVRLHDTHSVHLEGRSAYICLKAECLHLALKAKKLQKALKCPIPGDIVGILTDRLEALRNQK